ncbi:tRNA pseudouridine(55) synthase TruB [Planococcus lenghuensis]|uniref:tRNA pseudouridine synthase B n=1 Tax=Planococcus lenghuensis TaxID=2213202 RepID=A0A1Q2L017_9BACL|nr:tRNA pseudouridine(55) synthase TruB [Planococcus lenghuensis]AQQ53714.1 tRNA pseudouridine(55) synthase TruB [Planococcus lenghuensis]
MELNGILPLWKERGMTSHDCVFKLRKILKMKKIGHTGTLDPDVEGVLPICIGQATKVAEYLTDSGKAYRAEVTLGYSTETEDASGEMVEENTEEKQITREQLQEVLKGLTGEITQVPPMYSAVKVNGRRLYEYARKGIEVKRPERKALIHSIELVSPETVWSGRLIRFTIDVKCGKGTYIRTLAVQIGEALGYPAHMSRLTRTASGNFSQRDCVTLAEVAAHAETGAVKEILKPVSYALSDFPAIELEEKLRFFILNGQVLDCHPLLENQRALVFTEDGVPVAVYRQHPTKPGKMKPEKMFPASGKEEV